jgi:heme-binding uptake protein ChaN (Tiki superfamily)
MSFRSVAAKSVLRIVAVMTVAGATESPLRAQSPQMAAQPDWHLPSEAAGIEAIVRALIAVFDQADLVALGEAHDRRVDSDLRIALVRNPDFAKKVRFIVVEFGSTTEQSTLDRYIRGENVSAAQLAQVWKTTTQAANGVWDDPMYAEFFAAVRDVNTKLPADGRIRVFGGDPGPGDTRSRDGAAVSILKEQVLHRHGKALVVYGAAHFYRTEVGQVLRSVGGGIARTLNAEYPGRTLSVIPVGGRLDPPPGATLRVHPDYQKFDRALRTQVRPVLVPLQRLPFRDFSAEEFLGGGLFNCLGPGGCRSTFQGSGLTLGQLADALVYLGEDAK